MDLCPGFCLGVVFGWLCLKWEHALQWRVLGFFGLFESFCGFRFLPGVPKVSPCACGHPDKLCAGDNGVLIHFFCFPVLWERLGWGIQVSESNANAMQTMRQANVRIVEPAEYFFGFE